MRKTTNTNKCIGCVITKLKLHHKFPIRCPMLRMPCALINSEIIMNKLTDESYRYYFISTYRDGIPNNDFQVIDQNMLKKIIEQEKKIVKEKGRQALDYTEYGVDGIFMPEIK